MEIKDSKGQKIYIEDTAFAHGGEGAIHVVTGTAYAGCCIKIFHEGKLPPRVAKLEHMIQYPLTSPVDSCYRICWPLDFVYLNSACIGFVMPMSFANSHSLYDINLKDGSVLFQRTTTRGMENRFKLLYNISNALNILHAHGYVLSDFKPQNILFTDSGQISIIDLDSIQIVHNDSLIFEASALTQEYAYPKEFHLLKNKKPLTTAWDVYSFAIVAYQILMGIHPFTASTNAKTRTNGDISGLDQLMSNNLFPFGPRKNDILQCPSLHYHFLQLPKSLRQLFVKTFDLHSTPPTMVIWKDTLKESIYNGTICPNMFRAKPKVPILVFISDIPENANIGSYITLEWKSFNCDKISISGQDCINVSKLNIVVPPNRIIDIDIANKTIGNIQKKIVISQQSLFCTHCGSKFESEEDVYCTYCGNKCE